MFEKISVVIRDVAAQIGKLAAPTLTMPKEIPQSWLKTREEIIQRKRPESPSSEDDPLQIKKREESLIERVKAIQKIKKPPIFINWLGKIQSYINTKIREKEDQYKTIGDEMRELSNIRMKPGEEASITEDIQGKMISLIKKLPLIGDNLLFSMFSSLFKEEYDHLNKIYPTPAFRRASVTEMLRKTALAIFRSSISN